eukprot:scaffold129027_cov21-Tisochrysis_lutea.AAC.1
MEGGDDGDDLDDEDVADGEGGVEGGLGDSSGHTTTRSKDRNGSSMLTSSRGDSRGGVAPGVLRPGIVHRLDIGTSGLLVVAKREAAQRHLAAQFKARTVSVACKESYAAVEEVCAAPVMVMVILIVLHFYDCVPQLRGVVRRTCGAQLRAHMLQTYN